MMTGATTAATRSIQGKPNQMIANRSGPKTTADSIRSSRPRNRLGCPAGALTADAAIATFAPAELGDRLLEMLLAEIGPQRVDEHQLGIGALPEQEIADPLLAAGPDQKVGIGHAGSEQFALEQILVDALGRQFTGGDLAGEASRGA